MKKVLSILIVTTWLMQAVTINVHAARLYQGETPNVTVTGSATDIGNEDYAWQAVATENNIDGSGTPLVIATTSATMRCRGVYPDGPGETSVCPFAETWVDVVNDTGASATLTACADIYVDPSTGAPLSNGRFKVGSVDIAWTALPIRVCTEKVVSNNATVRFTLASSVSSANGQASGTGFWTEAAYKIHLDLYLAWGPVDTCDDHVSLSSDTYEIDPTIETPVGSPTDDQMFTTVTGEYYAVSTSGGPWNDGTVSTREDAAVSWDGVTWGAMVNVDAECIQSTTGGGTTYYLLAASETFYIRVNDTAGNFANNSASTAFTFTIENVYMMPACDSQYTYGAEDEIGDVTVPGNSEAGVLVSSGLIPGEWYTITVVSGTWQDEGSPPDRTDMELRVDGDGAYNEDPAYHDLSAGGAGVGCQSSSATTWYIQAQNTDLHLRVNNETGTFSANTGSLSVTVYHAAYERGLETCEIKYTLNGLQDHEIVSANAGTGKQWAFWSGPGTTISPIGNASAGNLVPGAWYVLDTTDGPWSQSGSGLLGATAHPATAFYDMAVSTNHISWTALEDWTLPDCNIEIDALGHRRIYFQAPSDAAFTWYFRVDDGDGNWNSNAGDLGWNLYRTTNAEALPDGVEDPWGSCGDEYPNRLLYNSGTTIPVQEEEGTYLREALLGIASSSQDQIPANAGSSMSIGDIFKITIKNGPWQDGGTDRYDAALSSDDGETWYPLIDNDNPALDCVSVSQDGKYYSATFTVAADQRWKVRVNDGAGDFLGNTGNLSYVMYKLSYNDASALGEASSGTGLLSAAGLGIASGGIAVCAKQLMYPTAQTIRVALTIPDQPVEFDVWKWTQWLGMLMYEITASAANYVADVLAQDFNYAVGWINYAVLSMQKYFAFCPKDMALLTNAINALKNKEPLATVFEAITIATDVKDQIAAHDWGGYDDTSLFSIEGAGDVQRMISQYILRRDGTVIDPWSGSGDVVSFDNAGLPSSFYSCGTAFTEFLPDRLRTAVCFVMAYFKETGAMFWVQLLVIDIGALSIIVMSFKSALQELIYMMTGVKPWTKSGASAGMDKLAAYMEKRDREEEIDRQFRRRR